LQDAVRRFAREEVLPQAADYDRTMAFPWEVVKKAHASGFMNVDVPGEYGMFKI
jgi:acyl-CoA dehydrogenase